jgi:protein-disulfide isomerase
MEKSNAYVIAALLAVVGFMIGRWDAGPAAPAAVAAAAPEAAAATEAAAALPPSAPAAPVVAQAAPEAAAPPAAAKPQSLDSQSDEGAGKGADLAAIAKSPKDKVPYLGVDDDARVLVTVFSDFQCPVCRRSADPIKQLVLDFPGKVKVVFRHNALEMHGRSQPAAVAALAAQRQGKFWQFHDKLFETGRLDDAGLLDHARAIGLDVAKFQSDLADGQLVEWVRNESKMAESLGASGTPAFFVNGQRQVGWGSYMALKSMVAREIAAGDALVQAGAKPGSVVRKRIQDQANSNGKNEGETVIDGKKWADLLTQKI